MEAQDRDSDPAASAPVAGSDPGPEGRSLAASRWADYRPEAASQPSPADLDIREAGADDCAAIAGIEASRDGVDARIARQRCDAQVVDPETLLLVALVNGRVVGFARAGRLRRPPDAAPDYLPDGWYLLGVVVLDAWRRHGIGHALTDRRVTWIEERADDAYYFTNARNRASLDLHRSMGFAEVTDHFSGPGITFEGGRGLLFRLDLRSGKERQRRAGDSD